MVRIDDNHFSPKSSASRLLANALRVTNHDGITRITIKYFERYIMGLSEIIKMDNPTRNEVFIMWHQTCLDAALKKMKPLYDEYGLPFAEYENLLMFRLREARRNGDIMQRMRM
jgi:hypothetical protein